MITSMTGYGRADISSKIGKFTFEIQSLNRKFLETFLNIPKEMMRFEIEIKRLISEKIKRGQVSIRITKSIEKDNIKNLIPDENILAELSKSWINIAKKLKLDPSDVNISFLASQSQQLSGSTELEDEKKLKEVLKKGIDKALDELVLMKQKEGATLVKDIEKRLKFLSGHIKTIESHSPNAAVKFKEKLLQKISEFTESNAIEDDRILREIAIYSDKIDVTEEILRFKSHIEQFSEILLEKKEAVGRKMDFLIQEMIREINTIASKSSEVIISKCVIEVKTELERIREQVQNIE